MRFGPAVDLHAPASSPADVSWPVVRDLVLTAERLGLDLVALPDHLAYRSGENNGYSLEDEHVGARESMTVGAALAAATSTIDIAHSVVNAPYRSPAMLAHLAASLADISGGRYSLGIGAGNSFDYDQLGVADDRRASRLEECLTIVTALLRDGEVDLDGRYWQAHRALLPLRPDAERRVGVVVAAGGPRTTELAARFGDAWNGFVATDPGDTAVVDALAKLTDACERVGRDPASIGRTIDLGVDALDVRQARSRSIETLERLVSLGIDEVRCYLLSDPVPGARSDALHAFAELVDDVRASG